MNENTFINSLKEQTNFTYTENGALAHKSTLDAVYDLFALGGAYRGRSDDDCIVLFKKAFEENEELALKCLFYLRDIRGGQGERRFFRVCFNWLAKNYPEAAFRNIDNVPEYGRWDDLYCLENTELKADVLDFMRAQIVKDLASYKMGENEGVSLLAKWLKSENASSKNTKYLAAETRKAFRLSQKQYRKTLSKLRKRINIVESLISQNRYNEIEYDKIPSKAGLIYRNAFARKDGDRYNAFINNKNTKVNANTLYPYDIVRKVTEKITRIWYNYELQMTDTEREVLNKYWANQKDYLNGNPCKMMCVVDTSGSMTDKTWKHSSIAPIDVAISLGIYCGERIGEPFKNCFISFSSRPQFIQIEGVDFCDKVRRIYAQNLCEDTDLKATFDLLLNMYTSGKVKEEDMPEQLVIISDMEINEGSYWGDKYRCTTEMEKIHEQWAAAGLKMPKLVYWNVNAGNDIILDDPNNKDITFVSGCSPVIFESIIEGKSAKELMLDKLNSDRYSNVK